MSDARTVVLIPYYNSLASLLRSLASIDHDEHCDVLIVDDGSTREPVDEVAARAAWPGSGDLEILVQPVNQGIEHALNAGLEWILTRHYTYVARLDCGDRNRPGRLARQEAYLDAHPHVLLVGGAAAFVDQDGAEQFVYRLPTTRAGIIKMMRKNSAFMHPAVMFRVSALALVGRYDYDVPAAEDYAFFYKFLEAGEVANLPDVLIDYELDPGGISLAKRHTQLASRLVIQRRHSDGSLAARAGIARTMVLQRVPYSLVFRVKKALRSDR